MKSRTILITGGTGKFGRPLIGHFLSIGDRVIATYRTDEPFEKLLRENDSNSKNLVGIKVDLTEPNSTKTLVEQLETKNIRPDCLINGARNTSFLKIGKNGLISRENFSNELLLDVIVPYDLTMAIAAQKNSRLKRVVNIGSQYGTVAVNPHLYSDPLKQPPLHYGVSKAALVHLTKELAVLLADKGIQVNCVAFGGVEGRVDEAFKKRYAKQCPMGRMLKESEVVGPVDMLLTDNFSGMTGHVLAVDGGWSIW